MFVNAELRKSQYAPWRTIVFRKTYFYELDILTTLPGERTTEFAPLLIVHCAQAFKQFFIVVHAIDVDVRHTHLAQIRERLVDAPIDLSCWSR